MSGAQAAMLPDGRRLHLQHGPIDLIIAAFGATEERQRAYCQAVAHFPEVLPALVTELAMLRQPVRAQPRLTGPVAQRMEAAVRGHLPAFVTPMAAVAGAVADEMLAVLIEGRRLERAYVNNGGDAALHLTPGTAIRAAIASDARLADRLLVRFADPVRGIATSGWRGRSFSLGIADAVTVTAASAAAADAAATLIANAVDLPGHPAIRRAPACELDPDSDLGERPVTVEVRELAPDEIAAALEAGAAVARTMAERGLIIAAALFLAGRSQVIGALPATPA